MNRRTLLLILCGLTAAAVGVASTAPARITPFFFVQLSDPQFGMYTADADFAQETANVAFAIATVNRLRPAFVVVTGDLVNKTGDAAQVAEYKRIVARLDPRIPLHSVAGNHDVLNEPTPASLAAYRQAMGPDHYSFRVEGFVGIVLNSSLFFGAKAGEQARDQRAWLERELERARQSGVRHIVVFQHHPPFLNDPSEPDEYFNVPQAERRPLLALFEKAGVRYVFAGHHHRNGLGRAGDLEVVTTGPIGMPLGGAKSGMRVVTVTDEGLTHRYYELGDLPNRIELPK